MIKVFPSDTDNQSQGTNKKEQMMKEEIGTIETLTKIIQEKGPIKTARISSAKASGKAKLYSYWGVARYEIRLSREGKPINVCVRSASSDRRSQRLVARDLEEVCREENRIICDVIGRLNETEALWVLQDLTSDVYFKEERIFS